MRKRIALVLLALLVAATVAGLLHLRRIAGAGGDPAFFESEIRAFEAADRVRAPEPGGIVFVGSSSIRFWSSLADDFAPLRVLNRGFGGAHFEHLIHNVRRIVVPYAPRAIVVYAGDNDLAAGTGKDAARVVRDVRAFVRLVHDELPEAEIYLLSIKPSQLRWDRWPEMAQANDGIAAIAGTDPRLHYVDVATPLLGDDGTPRSDFFWIDLLHLNEAGYAAWARVLRPRLMAAHGANRQGEENDAVDGLSTSRRREIRCAPSGAASESFARAQPRAPRSCG